jgi:hypothetical protein
MPALLRASEAALKRRAEKLLREAAGPILAAVAKIGTLCTRMGLGSVEEDVPRIEAAVGQVRCPCRPTSVLLQWLLSGLVPPPLLWCLLCLLAA